MYKKTKKKNNKCSLYASLNRSRTSEQKKSFFSQLLETNFSRISREKTNILEIHYRCFIYFSKKNKLIVYPLKKLLL